MVRCCIWVRGSSEKTSKGRSHTLYPACIRQVTLSHPQITIALGYFLVAANLLHTSTKEAKVHLSLHDIPKLILIYGRHGTDMTVFTNILSCGRHRTSTTFSSDIWGGKFPVGVHVHPVNGGRLILRTLYEHLTTLYLIWSPVPK